MKADDLHIFNETMPSLLDHYTRELVRKHALATKELDENQLVEIIRQQIASGDILKTVHIGVGHGGNSTIQQITYMPYSGVERLKAENVELKRKLKLVSEAIS